MPDLPEIREGDLAFAWNIRNIADVLQGAKGIPVRLTRWSHPTTPTLSLVNRTAGGPILAIYEEDQVTPVLIVTKSGLASTRVGGYLDFQFQSVAPVAPGAATGRIRMYARAGNLYFKVEGSGEQQIPIGPPPGPSTRYAFVIGG